MQKQTIGFIGLGVMGKSMARNIMKAGYPLIGYSRTKEKCADLITEGMRWADTVQDVAVNAEIILTMVGFPKDVEEVYLGEHGLINQAKAGTYLIDMTTSAPQLAKKLFAAGKEKGIHVLDAPVSGGDIGARNGALAIMVGGEKKDFDMITPLFRTMGTNIEYQGSAGSGQHTKLCNQMAIAGTMIGVCESLVYAKRAGLDPETVLKSISGGAAGSFSLTNLAPRILKGDFEPGFYIKHFIKDLKIVLDESEALGLDFPGVSLAKSLYEELAEEGLGEKGTQALYKYWK
ncbi:NAD(P)-dependent oxidoreductase [Pradoshia sp.]|uniref:NAD(P)-dependent oxidoreductase n=1 Tax=Pradoshia sp. TaxID=2651281 RepID=UPI003F10172F